MSRVKCSQCDLTYKRSTRPVTLTRTLESHMEATRGTALSILTSIGSDMHECRLACRPMYMHHTQWSAGHPKIPSRLAKHQGWFRRQSTLERLSRLPEPHHWLGTRLKLTSDPFLHFDLTGMNSPDSSGRE